MLEQPDSLNLVVKLGKPGGFAGISYFNASTFVISFSSIWNDAAQSYQLLVAMHACIEKLDTSITV
jgi:hypothetical protein